MTVITSHSPKKLCFVTIGATASFDALINAALSTAFLEALRAENYTDLLLQHGSEGGTILREYQSSLRDASAVDHRLKIDGFDFNKQGLGEEMRAAKGGDGGVEGLVISHAGTGSILDALRISVPLIVVPNPTLLDNHQVELAEEIAAQGYVVHGHLNSLPAAIKEAEILREKKNAWPPKDRDHDPSGRGLAGVMDDEMGFVD